MSKYLRITYRVIKKISPSFASICAGIYCNITGWRFDDLKKYFTQYKQKNNIFTVTYTINKIDNARQVKKLAILSPLPPEETGIASFTYYAFRETEYDIDIYTMPRSDEDLLLMNLYLGENINVLDASLTIYGLEKNNYNKIIMMVGNSYHHYYLHDIIKKIEYFNLQDKFVIYIHDPFINNFIQAGLRYSNIEYISILKKIYNLNDDICDAMKSRHNLWEIQEILAKNEIFGIKWLYNKGFNKFLVNSEAAANFVRKDIGHDNIEINKIFHPVFKSENFGSQNDFDAIYLENLNDSSVKVGSFGLPGNGKYTELIIKAVRLLMNKIPNIKLILAGYGQEDYFRKFPELKEDFIEIFESPSDRVLNYIMSKVDIAVQLRRTNLGESSGVVPQLLGMNKKVICSPIGSFNEYGDAVTFFTSDSADKLANTIIETLKVENCTSANTYCEERTSRKFCDKLFHFYS